MKKLLSLTTILSLFIYSFAFCQKKMNEYRGRKGEALSYELVESREWGANVAGVKLSYSTRALSGFPKMAVRRTTLPGGSMVDSQIQFYDDGGNLIYTKELGPKTSVFQKSEAGNYVILLTMLKEVSKEEAGLIKLELIDSSGQVHWAKEEALEYEGDNMRYCIANDGSSVRINDTQGILVFNDLFGNSINEIDIFEEVIWSRGRIIIGKFSQGSNYFAVTASDDVGSTFLNDSGVILFDNRGKEIWRHHTNEKNPGNIWISPSDRHIIAFNSTFEDGRFTSKATYLFDFQGNLIKRSDQITNKIQFSSTDNYATMIGDGLRRLRLIDLNTGELKFRYSTVGKQEPIHSADVNEDKKLIGLVKEKEIMVFHFNQVPAWSQAISHTETDRTKVSPVIKFSQDGQELVVSLNSGIYRYRLSQ